MPDDGTVQAAESRADVDLNIKAAMRTFLQCAVAIVLESWDDSHRYMLYLFTLQCPQYFKHVFINAFLC